MSQDAAQAWQKYRAEVEDIKRLCERYGPFYKTPPPPPPFPDPGVKVPPGSGKKRGAGDGTVPPPDGPRGSTKAQHPGTGDTGNEGDTDNEDSKEKPKRVEEVTIKDIEIHYCIGTLDRAGEVYQIQYQEWEPGSIEPGNTATTCWSVYARLGPGWREGTLFNLCDCAGKAEAQILQKWLQDDMMAALEMVEAKR